MGKMVSSISYFLSPDMPDIMNELEPELCALSDSPETTPQKKIPGGEPMPLPCSVLFDRVANCQKSGPEDVDGAASDGDTAPERTVNLLGATFTQETDGECLPTQKDCDTLEQSSLFRDRNLGNVQPSGMCNQHEANSVFVTKDSMDNSPVEKAGMSRGDKSVMDVSSQGGRANVSTRRENTSCQNLSQFSFLVSCKVVFSQGLEEQSYITIQ